MSNQLLKVSMLVQILQNRFSVTFHFSLKEYVNMIDAVIRNLIKFMKILPALITLLNILEDTHAQRRILYTHTQLGVKNKKNKKHPMQRNSP